MNELTFGILHFSDRNMQDRYYEAPIPLFKTLQSRMRTDGFKSAWAWWLKLKRDGMVRSGGDLNMTLDVFFLDFYNPIECVDEWDLDECVDEWDLE